jgi:hypothetical protein
LTLLLLKGEFHTVKIAFNFEIVPVILELSYNMHCTREGRVMEEIQSSIKKKVRDLWSVIVERSLFH